jgi:pimeloyl-ACP methyl ester carboxylesterase
MIRGPLSATMFCHARKELPSFHWHVSADVDKANPPAMEAPDIASHGANIHAVMYLASGLGPHPTVVLMHGFPGNEQNMDLAYSIRRAGWNVLVPHYRGSWGSQGTFSFANAIEDTQASVQFLREPTNAAKYRVDAKRIVLIGHSMGGFMVSRAAAGDPQVMGVAMIAAWNIGASMSADPQSRNDLFRESSPRLAGTTPEGLFAEIKQYAAKLNYLDDAPALKDRPVLVLEADDRNISYNQEMVAALHKAGNTQVTEQHIASDHVFSDHRIALQTVVIEWLQAIAAAKPK